MKEKMKILIAYDGSQCADAALLDLKRACLPRKSEAHVLSVCVDWMPASVGYEIDQVNFTMYPKEWKSGAQATARRARGVLKETFPDWEIHAETLVGAPANLILKRANEVKSDLIVVGSHGRSALGRLFLGSVSLKVLHAAHCAVRIARAGQGERRSALRLIVGVDGSKGAEAAVNHMARRRWPSGSEVKIINGFPSLPALESKYADMALSRWIDEEKQRLGEAVEKAARWLKGAGLTVNKIFAAEDAREILVGEAEKWEADCVFVGAQGMGAIERALLGSVSTYVVTHAPCTVEVVREP
jgi:nucleotide-binding universal stress UspA family protein